MRFDLFSSSFFQNAGRQLCFRPAFFLSKNRPMKWVCQEMKSVQQGATTIHEAGAAYTVSTSSLTMEVEAVTVPSAALDDCPWKEERRPPSDEH